MAKTPAEHHENDHPFHMVNPSPWPMAAAMVLLLLTTGAAMFFHSHTGGGFLLTLGVVGILGIMYAWWRDVIREGIIEKVHNPVVQHGLRWGMALFILSEVMFFVAFFWAFFHSAFHKFPGLEEAWPLLSAGVWPPANIHTLDAWDLPLMNTLILLLSGTTVTWAHHALLEGKNKDVVTGLAITVALGITFSILQAVEYGHALFSIKDGVYPSTFYLLTGFHGFHVIVGTAFLAVNLIRAKRGTLSKEGHLGFEFAAWYWHVVDVVWLLLFAVVYWWGS